MTLEVDLRNERENKRQETLRLLVQLLAVRSALVSTSKVRVKLTAHEVSLDREPVGEHLDATNMFVPVYDTHRTEEDTSYYTLQINAQTTDVSPREIKSKPSVISATKMWCEFLNCPPYNESRCASVHCQK